MRVLVAGSGGREHALVWKIARSPLVERVYAAPGNAGMAAQATLVPQIKAADADGLIRLAGKEGIDLVVIGPEDPLADGVADRLREAGYQAQIDKSELVTRDHVQGARAAYRRRHGLSEDRTHEYLVEGVIRVDTEGTALGTVNGLAVYDLGHHRFGKPSRISARVGLGREGIINVERQGKGPQLVLSRASELLVKKLFEQEVPEIYDGTVSVVSVARDAGERRPPIISPKPAGASKSKFKTTFSFERSVFI